MAKQGKGKEKTWFQDWVAKRAGRRSFFFDCVSFDTRVGLFECGDGWMYVGGYSMVHWLQGEGAKG